MTGKVHVRLAVLAALAALAAVLVVPGGLAAGSHVEDPITSGEESIVYLELGSGSNDFVEWQSQFQDITTKNNDCLAVSFDDPDGPALLAVNPFGGQLGEVKDSLGVKSPADGSGEPCGRVEAEDGEAISVSLGADLDDYLMTAVDVDLELKFEADVKVEYFHDGATEPVATDMFDPSDDADDGPDSNDGDNYRYFHRPTKTVDDETVPIYFDEVKFTPLSGAISLEGGADGTKHDEDVPDDESLDKTRTASQFAVIETFDGEISCGDEVTISESGIDVSGLVTMHSLFDSSDPEPTWDPGCTLLKLYKDDVTDASLFFEPELEDTSARYTLVYTAIDQAVTTDSNGQITSLEMKYDPTAPFTLGDSVPLQACQGQPVLDDDPDTTEVNEYDEFWSQSDVGLLPEGELACFYSATVTTTGADTGDEVWGIYFEDDPGWFS